ncbi:uncharacterized protein LOC109727463 [Ananas comosus]|uniref:ATP-dependent DNA helicase n=1 Tax=Ananas comosus TaxID=4615 RepID=A0A6P5GZA5_ANACO|nr:uncharacterized protein LOC109727463 [Ananas comosus]
MSAFTSIGAKVDYQINNRPGPYVFRISGQNHHLMGSLLPPDGHPPKFAQLYIYDTENEINNRIQVFDAHGNHSTIDKDIVSDLITMFDNTNEIVKAFRMARDRFEESDYLPIRLRLIGARRECARQYNPPSSSEIAGLIIGDLGCADRQRDIVVEHKTEGLKRISDLHPSLMAMQYPILFPYGEDGFMLGIRCNENSRRKTNSRQCVTMREFYAYRIQNRSNEGKTLIRGGRLFQQYIVDAFTCVEEERLSYIRNNQSNLRSEIYKGIRDAVIEGDVDGNAIGKRIILPSSFTAGPRYMIQNYQDAIAICRSSGPPDLFITFTCNAQWQEIRDALQFMPGQRPEDRPDIISRVFKMKLEALMNDIKKERFFGQTTAELYTVEFQKRGLPHVHILLWLCGGNKYLTSLEIDSIISAEIPDKTVDPDSYTSVAKFMMHGPCGLAKPNAPCMVGGRCSKHFPKNFKSETVINDDGYPIYKRRNDHRVAIKNGIELDNRFVVPYNLTLVNKYQAHINVEWCNKSRLIKYLFKYVNKGPDRSAVVLENNINHEASSSDQRYKQVDEIKQYLDCRYLSAYEAIWRLFDFDIHFRQPSVERLTVHLPMMNNVTYHSAQNLINGLRRPNIGKTMFTSWMETNQGNDDARDLTYAEFPTKWVWHPKDKFWSRRKQGNRIGRIVYIHPSAGELYYLRMLLNVVRGPRDYAEIRTVNGVTHETFRSACQALGLLGDDNEWRAALSEATLWCSACQLRQLFVTILLYCEVTDPLKLWEEFWESFADDIVHKLQTILGLQNLRMPQVELQNHVLFELEILFNKNGSSLAHFKLPIPNRMVVNQLNNRLLREELDYNLEELEREHLHLFRGLTDEQREIYNAVLISIYEKNGDVIFVYGHGGTGKTYLWKTIICKLHSEGRIVLAVASSGIASLLLPGGRTAHSRFKIPIKIDDSSVCEIKKSSQLAKLISHASLIIWDEAPMNHKNCFEALDRTLKDILELDDSNAGEKMFGGKTVLLGGDFRQILPSSSSDRSSASLAEFSKWILDIEIYDCIGANYNNPAYLRDRAIVTPTNEMVDELNAYVYKFAMEYQLLSELSLQSQNCKIKGYSLQGTIRKKDTEEFKSRLAEGKIYLIEKFSVIPSKKKFVTVERPYMVQINRWTFVTLVEEEMDIMPLYSFNFSNFQQVENQRYNDTVLTEKIHLSTCSASKIYIDLQIPEVIEFLERLQTIPVSVQQLAVSQQQIISPQEEICMNRKTVAQLFGLDVSNTQNIKYTCRAKISDIDTSFGWWYKACYNCKSAVTTFDDTFLCSNCDKNDRPPIPWYKLKTIVEDDTGSAIFTIFGRLAQDLIHIPAQNLATSTGSDKFTLPPIIKTIIGSEHVFQIVPDMQRFRTSVPSFKVVKIFSTQYSLKENASSPKNLMIKCEEKLDFPTAQEEIHKELFDEASPCTTISCR